MQNSGNPYGINQQSTCGLNQFGQPMQQDQFAYNQQNSCPNVQPAPGNPCLCTPGLGQTHVTPCNNFLPQNILDQIRNCVGNTAPIFILPNSQPIQLQQPPQIQQSLPSQVPMNMGYPNMNYPSISTGYPGPPPGPIYSPSCYPFPVPLPFYDPFGNQNRLQLDKNSAGCSCCRRNSTGNNSGTLRNPGNSHFHSEEIDTHRCSPGSDDTICTKSNCPVSVNLQALASQLLSLQGVIPCAATRLILRRVAGSNVTTTVEDTMERAQKSIGSLNKEQLITEARNAQQVNGLINLHMMTSPPQNIIPVLTMLQLKVNSLKALVENLVNKSVSECQSIGADGNTSLEPILLTMKSEAELRELLAILRQKECEERVNVSYAPYHSQRVVAESRLGNFQNKINQVEMEMERRRTAAMPWINSVGQFHQPSFSGGGNYNASFQETQCNGTQGFNPLFNATQVSEVSGKGFDSPSPFMVQVRSPRRLNLKPNIGGPQSTYHRSSEKQGLASPETFAVSKLNKDAEGCCENETSCSHKGSDNAVPSKETSDPGKGGTEVKKKLKIHIDKKGDLSVKKQSLEELDVGDIVQLSPEVVIVIDKVKSEKKLKKKKKMNNEIEKRGDRGKSEESIPSDFTCNSESSFSSRSSATEEKEEKPRFKKEEKKSSLKNILKSKKKTTTGENDTSRSVNHDIPETIDEVKPRSIKKEEHVVVASLSELYHDQFISDKKIDSRGLESVSLLEDHRISEDNLESPIIEENDDNDRHRRHHHTAGTQEKLDIIRENTDDLAIDDMCSPKIRMEKISSVLSHSPKNWSKKINTTQRNCNFRTSVTLLKEAQNQTVMGYNNSALAVPKETKKTRERSSRDNKENILEDPRTGTCSIIDKRCRENQTVRDSISSMDKDHRKRHNFRFK